MPSFTVFFSSTCCDGYKNLLVLLVWCGCFSDSQPVPQEGEKFEEHGPIDEPKTVAEVKQDPYAMPAGFEWVSLDVQDPVQLEEVYTLLTENYVEDDDNMFR
jgi:glycylpeptide N-tetradecanoyltransferase